MLGLGTEQPAGEVRNEAVFTPSSAFCILESEFCPLVCSNAGNCARVRVLSLVPVRWAVCGPAMKLPVDSEVNNLQIKKDVHESL